MRIKWLLPALLFPLHSVAQEKTDPFLRDILTALPDSLMKSVLQQPDVFRYQVIYTQINRDKKNKPSFKNYYLNVDPHSYFNPASMVKMPLAFLSLEKLNGIRQPGVDKFTYMQFDSGGYRQSKLYTDSTAEHNLPSIAQFIRKVFLISDNGAYNRMYEFLGQQQINRRLHEMGYPETRITRRFMRMSTEENRHTNPIRFINRDGSTIWTQPPAYNKDSFDFSRVYKIGRAHINSNDSLVNEPFDFTKANNYPLEDMQQQLQSVLFPNAVPKKKRFRLQKEDYDFLYRFMSQYPSETDWPKYDTSKYYDSYVKSFFHTKNHVMPAHVRVFNKVGWAYGCVTDVSYVADFKNNVEFMLSVTIYANSDGVLNDNRYEYETVAGPFLYKVGQAIYNYELGRSRKFRPDLSTFKLEYQLRKEDGRPVIKDADN